MDAIYFVPPFLHVLVKVSINGKIHEFEEGINILSACRKVGVFLPHICFLAGHPPSRKCGLCVIEINNNVKNPVFACMTKIKKGMVIVTESLRLNKIRRRNLRKIVKNHNVDCFKCFKSGSCILQKYMTSFYRKHEGGIGGIHIQNSENTFVNLTDNISFNMSQCIHCNRCNRFLEKTCKISDLQKISTVSEDNDLFENVVDICPTAALRYISDTNPEFLNIELQTTDTYNISNVFTPKMRIKHIGEKIISLNSIKKQWMTNDIRRFPRDGSSIGSSPIKLSDKVFDIGSIIDIENFFILKYIVENNEGYHIVIDDSQISREVSRKHLGISNANLSMIDVAIFIGIKKFSTAFYLKNLISHLKTEIFLDNLENIPNVEGYNEPHIFIDAEAFPSDISVLKYIENIPFSIIPKHISHIMTQYIDDYISTSITPTGSYSFLRSNRYYINIFGKIVKTSKLSEDQHDNVGIKFLKDIYGNAWRDILDCILENIREQLHGLYIYSKR
ncbi:MAG: (2Fe-2S)-binding protein [Holosporales bacterium]|jgi:uncharacterized Fe-S cluster protein YjdI|nr:(2Fe-2S)-binding protein [Holosporales bacterium]